MAFVPRADQIEDLQRCLFFNRWGLYNDPGVGKTVVAQAYAAYWVQEGERVLVLMPPVLLHQFITSFARVFRDIHQHLTCHILEEAPAKRRRLADRWDADRWPDVLCMSYQMFLRAGDLAKSRGYNVVVADEAHALKNPGTQVFKRLANYLGHWEDTAFLAMTGTPIPNELIDAYGLIKLTNPDSYTDFNQFDRRHILYKRIPLATPRRLKGSNRMMTSVQIRTGYRRKKEIRINLYRHASRRRKHDVLSLDKPTLVELPVRLSPEHLALYKKLGRERMLEINDEVLTALQQQALRQSLLQIVTVPELFVSDGVKIRNEVVACALQLLDSLGINRTKLLIFANYRKTIEHLQGVFAAFNPAVINGATRDPDAEKEKFISDHSCRLMIANPLSAGVGLDGLQYVCHTALFLEPTGVPGLFQQSVDRLSRNGQREPVTVYTVQAIGTLSQKTTESMLTKDDETRYVTHDKEGLSKLFYL